MAAGLGDARPLNAVPPMWVDLLAGGVLLAILTATLAHALDLPPGVGVATLLVYMVMAALLLRCWPDGRRPLGAANRVTLFRALLVALLAGALASPSSLAAQATPFAVLALAALLLDGVDGWVARRFDAASDFGARFDMELDAFLIAVLCLAPVLLGKVGPWVLAIGAMRYAFVAAMPVWRWLDHPLPDSVRRKTVCVVQVACLLACLLPAVDARTTAALLGVALLALAASFFIDIRWLYRRRAHTDLCRISD
ncbi:CDP-alcohol phosphatidyltransferase family protein [Methyloversatilis sp.]|uniref:CDP-alcohol phosphatidyltransferase family protein n=1 Tax=Methyloversatilis sp. TaxID=2569862 RepID=UPI0027357050|nr:CDP-alcohol phosphatidyltransferase family protein [Methyloversatilis sp.]MDP2868628.1 CDP-alcohol phosphatidyltransferase family protein [Methyloversatilis sp.]MDP3456657.1 CDP-alcohol phosphatidyltransferase family protein [Methyloversatilis sp.]MDP3577252.1 CDP-alcohol phosphatidyltransferase family protein [Methyloversatilis sp.]